MRRRKWHLWMWTTVPSPWMKWRDFHFCCDKLCNESFSVSPLLPSLPATYSLLLHYNKQGQLGQAGGAASFCQVVRTSKIQAGGQPQTWVHCCGSPLTSSQKSGGSWTNQSMHEISTGEVNSGFFGLRFTEKTQDKETQDSEKEIKGFQKQHSMLWYYFY